MTIQISNDQLDFIKVRFGLETANPNYAGMYKYIYDTFGQQMKDNNQSDQAYWFQQAADINRYLNNSVEVNVTQSGYFIQQINKLAGKDNLKIKTMTNLIAQNVYNDIVDINGGVIPAFED